MITPPLSLLGRLGRIGRVALVLAFACALIPLTAHAEPAESTKHPAGTMVQTERGPAFIPFDGAAYNARVPRRSPRYRRSTTFATWTAPRSSRA